MLGIEAMELQSVKRCRGCSTDRLPSSLVEFLQALNNFY